MQVLVVSATAFEVAPLEQALQSRAVQTGPAQYRYGGLSVSLLVTGVGLPLTAFALGRVLANGRFHLALNAGIAGALDRSLALGEVVQVDSDAFADLGVEEADGSFTDIHQLGLIPPHQPPFQDGRLYNNGVDGADFLPRAAGISVNRVHGHPPSIKRLQAAYPWAQVESMEGAAFLYACLTEQVPCLQIRAISNYVEARNRDLWDIPLAIANLNKVLLALLDTLAAGVR